MLAYVLRRLLATVPVILVIAVLVFLLLHLAPGDPAVVIAGDTATPTDVARIREQLGLDRPLIDQFFAWSSQIMRGDLGVSIFNQLPVTQLIGQRIEPTAALTLLTMSFSILVGVPAGVIAAWRVNTWVDRVVMIFCVLGVSMPVFLVGYLLIEGFSLQLGWLPVQGFHSLKEGLVPFIRNLMLPTLSASAVYIALLARMTRTTMLEVLNEEYIQTARAKGLGMRRVLFVHALKNAAIPIVTVIGSGVALLIGGVVVTESVFGLPGIGRLTVDAVARRDYPIVQGVLLLLAGAYVLINLMVDLSYSLFDPTLRR